MTTGIIVLQDPQNSLFLGKTGYFIKNKPMEKKFENIEALIAENDELYYWAYSWCKEHRASLYRFYNQNKKEVDERVDNIRKKESQ